MVLAHGTLISVDSYADYVGRESQSFITTLPIVETAFYKLVAKMQKIKQVASQGYSAFNDINHMEQEAMLVTA